MGRREAGDGAVEALWRVRSRGFEGWGRALWVVPDSLSSD